MNDSLINYSADFRSRLVELLWCQWTALGVSGSALPYGGDALLDPEALLLVSVSWARTDPRLFDEIFDWLVERGDWINLQRFSRIQNEHEGQTDSVLAALAEHLSQRSSHHKWKSLISGSASAEPAPLFWQEGHFGATDPLFLKWGWQRPPVRHRGLGNEPRMDQPSNLILKLRALFGRQSRAEVMAWLLTHESGHPAAIARDVAYFPRSVQLTLNELERSGMVRSHRQGREKHFSLDRREWKFLLGAGDVDWPKWVAWPVVFRLLAQAWELLSDQSFGEASDQVQAIELRSRLRFESLHEAGVSGWMIRPVESKGSEAVREVRERLDALLSELAH